MELKELKKKSISELHKILAENREKLRELRFKDANKQLKNVREVRSTRTTIAQIMTLLNAEPIDSPKPAKAEEQETIKETKK